MRTIVKLARLIAPVARLHDARNELVNECVQLKLRLRQITKERDDALVQVKRGASKTNCQGQGAANIELRRLETLRREGRLVEFEYPYKPHYRDWSRLPGGNPYEQMLARRRDAYTPVLQSFLKYTDHFSRISVQCPEDGAEPYWDNGWLPILDSVAIYGLLASRNPRIFLEVGSGNSTKFARKAISNHGLRTKIISIDPHPRAEIDALCDVVIRKSLEEVDLKEFSELGREDILYIDNSHRSFQGSDVTVFFTEILPILGRGCIYGIHDIPMPRDYSPSWCERFYNEQYLLMAYLLGGGGGDEIVLPVAYVSYQDDLKSILEPIFKEPAEQKGHSWGSSFWMRRSTG